jgi:hypothetical protein
MLRANQPVCWSVQLIGALHQRNNIGFSISDIN